MINRKNLASLSGAPKHYVECRRGQMKPDKEFRKVLITDVNHRVLPRYPMDPLFKSVELCSILENRPINFRKYDIVTDRNNLRKLFNFCVRYEALEKSFRIDVQRIGDVVVLIRNEQNDFRDDM